MSPYNFVMGNPVLLIDPNGEQPGRNQATSIKAFILLLRDNNVRSLSETRMFFSSANFVSEALRFSSGGDEDWRYIYTTGAGWIDMTHFLNGAVFGLELGEATEYYQDFRESPSAWSYEDLQSNLQGEMFNYYENRETPYSLESPIEGEEFYSALENWFNELGATIPEDAPNWGDLPQDHTSEEYGVNQDLEIPENETYTPLFAPDFEELDEKYKYEHFEENQVSPPIFVPHN